jgi:hypothetical protein
VAGAVMVIALAWTDTALVTNASELGDVTFGWPLAWVSQDLTALDPLLPADMGMNSPWEHPITDIRWLALTADLTALGVPLLAVVYGIKRSTRRELARA